MKTSLWIVVVLVAGFVGFLMGYSVSSATGTRAYETIRASTQKPAPPPAAEAAAQAAPQIIAGGTLRLDGVILATGTIATNERAGGGAGGSIWLDCQTLVGSGSISATGGAGEPSIGGGGAGGRIAVEMGTNLFSGPITAHGGRGATYGGAGTLYVKMKGAQEPFGSLHVENGGHTGTNSPLAETESLSVSVENAAVLSLEQAVTLGKLSVASNAWVLVSTTNEITISGDVRVHRGRGRTWLLRMASI